MKADNATIKIEYEVEIEDKIQNGPFQITRDKGKNAPLYSKTGHWSDK